MWDWSNKDAGFLYGLYTMSVYLTGIVGGLLADKVFGARLAVLIGGVILSLGHVCLAMDMQATFYVGLVCIALGTGLFKPNISTIVGQLYPKNANEKRDAGYTIFYMGVNSGAFLGTILCGYIGEKIAWKYGFGLAGVFMILGAIQFYFVQPLFGKIGQRVSLNDNVAANDGGNKNDEPSNVVWDRIIAIAVFSICSIFFWMAFEQAGGSMTIFARDFTDRGLVGTSGLIFKIVDTLLILGPILVLTWLLARLVIGTIKRYFWSNLFILISFTIVWGLLIWRSVHEFSTETSSIAASWFSSLNSFFIIVLAPLFSKMWQDYWKPSGPVKFAVGLLLLGLGFGVLAYGALPIPSGAKVASVSMIWLVLAYLLHTMGELCISPVGLSYISKLAPTKLLGAMFGVWFTMTAIANFLAGLTTSMIDNISSTYSLSTFFLIFTVIPIVGGIVMLLLNKVMLKLMHGIR